MHTETKPMQSLKDIIVVHGIEPTDTFNHTDTLRSILRWFEKTRPEKTARDYLAQLACHFEEVAECTDAIGHPNTSIRNLGNNMRATRDGFVDTNFAGKPLPEGWRKDLLDSLCDQIVTAIGVAHCANLDIIGALQEVNFSNWSKFENGEPIRDEYGKIIKGEYYKAPELDAFVLEAPKWVRHELQVGATYKPIDGTEVVEVLSIGALRTDTNRKMVTYRYMDIGDTYTTFEYDFREGFEPCN